LLYGCIQNPKRISYFKNQLPFCSPVILDFIDDHAHHHLEGVTAEVADVVVVVAGAAVVVFAVEAADVVVAVVAFAVVVVVAPAGVAVFAEVVGVPVVVVAGAPVAELACFVVAAHYCFGLLVDAAVPELHWQPCLHCLLLYLKVHHDLYLQTDSGLCRLFVDVLPVHLWVVRDVPA
jgi:hypothetical protein